MINYKKELESLKIEFDKQKGELIRLSKENAYLHKQIDKYNQDNLLLKEIRMLNEKNNKLKLGWDLERETNTMLLSVALDLRNKILHNIDTEYKNDSNTVNNNEKTFSL